MTQLTSFARSVDDGRPLPLFGAPGGVAGCAVFTHVCGNPTCPCTTMRLTVRRLNLAADGEMSIDETIVRGSVDSQGAALQLEPLDGASGVDDAMLTWIHEQLSLADQQAWLSERWRRGRGQAGDPVYTSIATRNDLDEGMVPFHEVTPWEFDLTVMHDGSIYLAEDMYCLKPRCGCDDVAVEFFDLSAPLSEVEGVAHGHASLRSLGAPTLGDGPLAKPLWAALVQQVGAEKLRSRYAGARKAAPQPRPHVAAPNIGRNAACPCGSGKKFKRCCG